MKKRSYSRTVEGLLSGVRIYHRGLLLAGVPLLVSMLFVAYLYQLLNISRTEVIKAWKSQQSASSIAWTGSLLFDAVSAVKKFGFTGDLKYRDRLNQIKRSSKEQFALAKSSNSTNMSGDNLFCRLATVCETPPKLS